MNKLKIKKHKNDDIELYSFDIFDTLITRTTALPTGIFSIIQNTLQTDLNYQELPALVRNNFFTIRRESECFVRKNKWNLYKKQDINFFEIYDNIKQNYYLTDAQVEKLKQLEIDTELKNLVPIPQNISKLKELISSNKRVILISDMYYDKEILKKFLLTIDNVFADIKIYVSSEYGKTKSSSSLYKSIQNEENVEFNKWCHFGDNINSDINQARIIGIKTIYLPMPQFKNYEQKHLFSSFLSEEDIFSQFLIGAAKLTRLLSTNKTPAYQFGCSFAGPLLYNYVNWVIEQALVRNIKNLYFVARDGYVCKLIADEIIQAKKLIINTKYIYGSRIAWRLPNKNTVMEYLHSLFTEYPEFFSINFLSMRLFIDVEELKSFAKINDYSVILDDITRNNLFYQLINNSDFINRILELNESKRNLLLEYLEQEVDFNENTIAFVDLYGSGRTQDLLSEIINTKYKKKILSLYFHSAFEVEQKENSQKINYFSTDQFKHFSIELLCRSIDGQTLGYKKENGCVVPILEENNKEKLLKWGYLSYLQGLIDFTKNASYIEIINNISINSYNLQKKYVSYYLTDLDKETAKIIGSIPYAVVGSEKSTYDCARELTFRDYKNMILKGNKDYQFGLNFISFKRSDKKFQKLYEFNQKHINFKKFLLKPLKKIFSIQNNDKKTHKILYFWGIKMSFAIKKSKYSFWENIFSVKKSLTQRYKILTILGKHIKLKKNISAKILLISQEMTYSGSPHSLLRICKILKKNNYDIEVWSLCDGDFKREFEKNDILVKIVTKNDYDNSIIINNIKNFDLAICNTVLTDYPYSIIKNLIPAIWYIREATNLPSFENGLREKLLYRNENVYCVSEYASQFIRKHYKTNAKVVHNCVEDFGQGVHKKYFQNNKINFLILGTIEKRKGIHTAVEAIKQLPHDLKNNVTLTIVGRTINSSSFINYYNHIIEQIKNEDSINYLGEITDITSKINVLKSTDVIIVPSTDEACSLVALEGLMMGCPIIVSNNVGAKYVVDKNTGWIFKTGDVKALASIIKNIVKNRNVIPTMGANARKKYLNTSNMIVYEKNILKLIKENL